MKIYRIEHKQRKSGPYNNPDYECGCNCPHCQLDDRMTNKLLEDQSYYKSHPFPAIKHFAAGTNLRFGCKSKKQLRAWFKEFLPELKELGYQVVVYNAKPIYEDDFQVAFLLR